MLLPLVILVFPLGTPDQEIFSKEVTQRSAALEQRIISLGCDQSITDISKNVLQIRTKKPDIIVLSPGMKEETLSKYSEMIFDFRSGVRDASGAEKFLVYHYENNYYQRPEIALRNEVDEYFPTLQSLMLALINHNRT